MKSFLLGSAISFAVLGSVWAAEVDVYLLGGQSNMQGLGQTSELTETQKRLPNKTFFWTQKGYQPFVVGETKTSARKAEFGPEVGLAKKLGNGKIPTYFIKYAASGMPLHQGWNGNKWVGGDVTESRWNFYPGNSASDPAKGKLYKQMLASFQAGLLELKKQGHTPVIKGFVWMQGEQDSKNELSALSYAKHLKLLKSRVEADTGADDLAMSFGQVLPYDKPMKRFTHRTEIRRLMEAADFASGKPEAIFKCRMISTDALPLLKDTVHYNTQGQLMLGEALAEGLKQAQKSGAKIYLFPNGKVPQFASDFKHKPYVQKDPERITDTSNPFMRVFLANAKNNTGKAVVIFPGGGYHILADKKEGDRVAAYYASKGVSCFVVKYRVSSSKNRKGYQFPGPMLDARRAMRIVRANAKEWGVDPSKVGVMGFSAGGHLAGVTATCYNDKLEGDEESDISTKPDFACLVYPVVSLVEKYSHMGSRHQLLGKAPSKELMTQLSPEKRVTKDTSPLFLIGNQWDFVKAENILHLALNAKKAGAACELHMYPAKDHGFGMGRRGQAERVNPAIAWPELCLKFILRQ